MDDLPTIISDTDRYHMKWRSAMLTAAKLQMENTRLLTQVAQLQQLVASREQQVAIEELRAVTDEIKQRYGIERVEDADWETGQIKTRQTEEPQTSTPPNAAPTAALDSRIE